MAGTSPAMTSVQISSAVAELAQACGDGLVEWCCPNVADRALKLVARDAVRHSPQIFQLGQFAAERQDLAEGLQQPPAHLADVELGSRGGFDRRDQFGAGRRVAGKAKGFEGSK